ncbi:MAG: hypothetical protein KGH59_01940 [Candidatus Micrarchaeota archaeon]|nr:hypothetical protein [Candidatus Micrarchaeota archaeon]MDE1804525.1 hypothetical protein [Candidatus Micrarchaeota archaeon]MDE1846966.1 hypothetical protein [Candidatus Micrarchaeota archaeon]
MKQATLSKEKLTKVIEAAMDPAASKEELRERFSSMVAFQVEKVAATRGITVKAQEVLAEAGRPYFIYLQLASNPSVDPAIRETLRKGQHVAREIHAEDKRKNEFFELSRRELL